MCLHVGNLRVTRIPERTRNVQSSKLQRSRAIHGGIESYCDHRHSTGSIFNVWPDRMTSFIDAGRYG
jgi:hypothetical protein